MLEQSVQAPSLDIFKTHLDKTTTKLNWLYVEYWFGPDDLQGPFLPTLIILWFINSPKEDYMLTAQTS